MIEFLGLDENAGAVYRALLAGDTDPVGLSEISGLPVDEVRVVLSRLAGLKLVRCADGSDDWHALRPDLAFAEQMRQYEADLARMTFQLAVMRAAATAAAAAAEATVAGWARLRQVAAPVEPLHTWQDVLGEARRLAAYATTEYLQVMPAGSEALAAMHEDFTFRKAAVARGVQVRALYQDGIRSDRAAMACAKRAALAGVEVRTAPAPPTPMLICDRQVALIQAVAGRPETALCIREPAIATVVSAAFDHSWNTATPLAAPITPDQLTGLTPTEQKLLQLLADGHTYQAAAKKISRSERTVKRYMADLQTKLKAASPFQAGVYAARSGWL